MQYSVFQLYSKTEDSTCPRAHGNQILLSHFLCVVQPGMSWWQAELNVIAGTMIILIPMVLNGYPGTKYGIPFPVVVRSSFGIQGAHIAGLLRGLVACGWFGINTWICADAISTLLIKLIPAVGKLSPLPVLGITFLQFSSYLFFWLIQVSLNIKVMLFKPYMGFTLHIWWPTHMSVTCWAQYLPLPITFNTNACIYLSFPPCCSPFVAMEYVLITQSLYP